MIKNLISQLLNKKKWSKKFIYFLKNEILFWYHYYNLIDYYNLQYQITDIIMLQ